MVLRKVGQVERDRLRARRQGSADLLALERRLAWVDTFTSRDLQREELLDLSLCRACRSAARGIPIMPRA